MRVSIANVGMEQNHKSRYSSAFVIAIAGAAGLTCDSTQDDFNGVDFTIRSGIFGVDVQLKSTDSPEWDAHGDYVLDLDVRTYNLLSDVRRSFPAYLVLVTVSRQREQWIDHLPGRTVLSHEARWVRLTGLPASENTSSVRVKVPADNLLTAVSLAQILSDVELEIGL